MPDATGAGLLSTAVDSPVSEDSTTASAAHAASRASAATVSPRRAAARRRRTTSRAGTCRCAPSRSTVAVAALIRASAATAPSARRSWTRPSTALATTITAITTRVDRHTRAHPRSPTPRGSPHRDQQEHHERVAELGQEPAARSGWAPAGAARWDRRGSDARGLASRSDHPARFRTGLPRRRRRGPRPPPCPARRPCLDHDQPGGGVRRSPPRADRLAHPHPGSASLRA